MMTMKINNAEVPTNVIVALQMGMLDILTTEKILPRSTYQELDKFSGLKYCSFQYNDHFILERLRRETKEAYKELPWLQRKCILGALRLKFVAHQLMVLIMTLLVSAIVFGLGYGAAALAGMIIISTGTILTALIPTSTVGIVILILLLK